MNILRLSKTQRIEYSCLFIFIIQIWNSYAYEQRLNDEDSFDVGIRLIDGKQDSLIADLIADERSIMNAGQIDGIGIYHFHIRRKHHQRSKREIDELIEDLKRDERIESITIGKRLERQKREYHDDLRQIDLQRQKYQSVQMYESIDTSKLEMSFNDDLYRVQWYLENKGQLNTTFGYDINMVPAWSAGYSGKGVVICIIDDGLAHEHPDISARYRADLSYDLNDLHDREHDPSPPEGDEDNSHGTQCAGAAASEANNGLCGVGPAHGAFIAAVRLLDGPISTLMEARSMALFAVDIDIKSASWGPTDNGMIMEAPGPLFNAAMDYAITYGRHGKGTIFVWASGNGGDVGDDCGADGYASHPNVISVGSINHEGKTVFFHEHCPSTMAVVYAGGKHKDSVNEEKMPIGITAPDLGGKCITNFFGTSAAAPVAAGAFAVVIEANTELTYRDVMHIIARTARIPTLAETDDWIINGAGFHVSEKFGFGVLDVGQMVSLAQNWTIVQQRYECYQEVDDSVRELKIDDITEISIDLKECLNITSIEHVVANISFHFHRRGDVKITLISPSGTRSELLSYRDKDKSEKGIKYFPYMSVHNWGEDPIGRWTLRMETRLPQTEDSINSAFSYKGRSELSYFGLRIYGSNDPGEKDLPLGTRRQQNHAFVPSQEDIHSIYQRELQLRNSPSIMQKRDYEKLLQERRALKQKRDEIDQDQSMFGHFRRVFHF